ncbi:hypothetical protein F4775DRAFT_590778 [Biscogniauxia sp. FL1348]|nr:hypothetical protein F4775DRAFT_590778 [Biscogniauxia sp. FL1348]
MSKHQHSWTAQDDLDLLVAICRANKCFSKPKTMWNGVEEYLTKKGHKRTTTAIRIRFNRILKPRILTNAAETDDYQVPCQTLGENPLLFSIPSHILSDPAVSSDVECPAISPHDFSSLGIKLVNLSSAVNLAAALGHADRDALPTQVGAITVDGSYQAFLVNRESLRGAKELSYTLPGAAGRSTSSPGHDTDTDDVFGRGFSLPFPNTAADPPQSSSDNSDAGVFPSGHNSNNSNIAPLIEPMARLMNPPSLPYSPQEPPLQDQRQYSPTRKHNRRRRRCCRRQPPQTPTRQPPIFPVEWFSTPRAQPDAPLFAGPATPAPSGCGVAPDPALTLAGDYPWLRASVAGGSPFHLSPARDQNDGGSPSPAGRFEFFDFEHTDFSL